MTDIVERLRVHARTGDGWTRPDCAEAADEIERLRMDRDVWRNESIKKQAACEQMGARITALEAERDRLRKILRLAEDVLSRPPWSNNMLADGRHPNGVIS
jgi:hypothetical protein